uniref:Uncharacterized protein n=1 Tax=Octopus bimaculoides TaxID=37653 RepID=A0A0L8GCL6_OCTBM
MSSQIVLLKILVITHDNMQLSALHYSQGSLPMSLCIMVQPIRIQPIEVFYFHTTTFMKYFDRQL